MNTDRLELKSNADALLFLGLTFFDNPRKSLNPRSCAWVFAFALPRRMSQVPCYFTRSRGGRKGTVMTKADHCASSKPHA